MPRSSQPFATVKTEGLLLPPELIARVADLHPKLPGIGPEDYNLPKGERINEVTNRSWNRLTALWARFRKELEGLSEGDAATGQTRARWLLPLFEELGYGRLQGYRGQVIGDRPPFSCAIFFQNRHYDKRPCQGDRELFCPVSRCT